MVRVHIKELLNNKLVVRLAVKDESRYLMKICSIYSDFVKNHLPTFFTSFNGESYAVYPYDFDNTLSNDEFMVWSTEVHTKCIDYYPNINKIY